MTAQMTPYDQRAWEEIEAWREGRLSAQARRVVPQKVRDRLSGLGRASRKRLDALPGAEEFSELFVKALGGLVDVGSRGAMATVREGAIVQAYRKRGHDVQVIDDISKVALRDIDKVKPNLALAYAGTATVEGAAAGFAVSGGQIVATGGSVLGAGAGAAPGIGMVAGVMAADAAAVLVAANRAVAHTAAYYGYDLKHPDERLFALGVLSVGTAAETGKAAAYVELNKLVQMLARRATWEQLRQNVVTGVIERVFTRLGFRITQRKLGQAVPVAGTLIGAGMNARLLVSLVDDADHIYRERFLRERYGLEPVASLGVRKDHPEAGADIGADTGADDGEGEGDVIAIAEIVDDEEAQAREREA